MSKTMQGAFEMVYHHIDAPTIQDDEWGKTHKQRKLISRSGCGYRTKTLDYLRNQEWHFKRKIDGANLRVQWNGEQALWNGKSNSFVCGANLTEYMNETFLEEIFEEKFGRDKVVTLFGEHMGPKVQGNELGLEKDEFILYDVNVDGTWLDTDGIMDTAEYFKIRTVYDLMDNCYPYDTLDELIRRVSSGEFAQWEGIVATPLVELRDQNGKRIIVKIKNRDYLREEE